MKLTFFERMAIAVISFVIGFPVGLLICYLLTFFISGYTVNIFAVLGGVAIGAFGYPFIAYIIDSIRN